MSVLKSELVLEQNDRLYGSNDLLKGLARVTTSEISKAELVRVHLRCNVFVHGKEYYDRRRFHQEHVDIQLNSKVFLPGKEYDFPFEFELPSSFNAPPTLHIAAAEIVWYIKMEIYQNVETVERQSINSRDPCLSPAYAWFTFSPTFPLPDQSADRVDARVSKTFYAPCAEITGKLSRLNPKKWQKTTVSMQISWPKIGIPQAPYAAQLNLQAACSIPNSLTVSKVKLELQPYAEVKGERTEYMGLFSLGDFKFDPVTVAKLSPDVLLDEQTDLSEQLSEQALENQVTGDVKAGEYIKVHYDLVAEMTLTSDLDPEFEQTLTLRSSARVQPSSSGQQPVLSDLKDFEPDTLFQGCAPLNIEPPKHLFPRPGFREGTRKYASHFDPYYY